MTASAADYVNRKLPPELAKVLATQVEGTPSAAELVGIGFPPATANALAAQMTLGSTSSVDASIVALMGTGVPGLLASSVATDIEATSAE